MTEDEEDREWRSTLRRLKYPRVMRFYDFVRSWVAPRKVCGACDHFFDSSDKRHYRGMNDRRYLPRCPACTIETLNGNEAWALRNDCQGLWDDSVRYTRAEAQELLEKNPDSYPDCYVYAVRVYEDKDQDMRHWSENQREKERA
jgi:hypothetical protein